MEGAEQGWREKSRVGGGRVGLKKEEQGWREKSRVEGGRAGLQQR